VTGATPLLTVVIPTRDRPAALPAAIASALAQTAGPVEVVVSDDGSKAPVEVAPDERVSVVRSERSRGVAAARNAGLFAARGRYVTFLDDDNVLLPRMAEVSIAALERSTLPPPVAVVSAIDVTGPDGRVLDRRLPPTHPRGEHYSLEPLPPGRSHMTKQTLLVDRELLVGLGGFDEGLLTREMTDLMLRLNRVCSIQGIDDVTYHLTRGPGPRISRSPGILEEGFHALLAKHRDAFAAHPVGLANAWLGHARMSLVAGPRRAVLPAVAHALRAAPAFTLRSVLDPRRGAALLRTWTSSG
jgi:glycosyl transferase family 2